MARHLLLGVAAAVSMTVPLIADEASDISYRRQIAPLLQKYCTACHGAADPESGLSLHTMAGIRRGSSEGPVLNAARPAESRLLVVLQSEGRDHMPPLDQPQPAAAEVALLQHWVGSGAIFDVSATELPGIPLLPPHRHPIHSPVLSMAVSADGSQLAVARFREITVSPVGSFESRQTIPLDEWKITDLEFHPDGTHVLAATGIPGFSGRGVTLELPQGNTTLQFTGHADMVYAASRSPDGLHVATAGYDRRILLHDAQTGSVERELTGHNGAVFDVAFSPDGRLLASASADATIKIWSVTSGERLDTMSQPLAEQYSVTFSPDAQRVYAAGADNRIRMWQVLSQETVRINPLIEARYAHEGAIQNLLTSPDGRLVASSADDGFVRIWDATTLRLLVSHQLDADIATTLAFAPPAGQLLAGTQNGQLLRFPLPALSGVSETADRVIPSVSPATSATPVPAEQAEQEPNDDYTAAQVVSLPVTVSGVISPARDAGLSSAGRATAPQDGETAPQDGETAPQDIDSFRFSARAGQQVLMEVRAARDSSPLDSRIEVLDQDGQPVLQTRLQAVRDSYFAFRGKDARTTDDFRLFNWQEMDLNQYVYADGEVVRLWLYPRGPDSGFKVYPGSGSRYTYFGTTATYHALQSPAFVVVPRSPAESITENGLPVFPVYYENDDDPLREWGSDSRLMFVAPRDGDYVLRLTDARGFSGSDFRYQLTLRAPRPDFKVGLDVAKVSLYPGTGRELVFTATRIDGYTGPIELLADLLPPGLAISLPTQIEQDQQQAVATLSAAEDAVPPDAESVQKIRFHARAVIGGTEVVREIGGITELSLGEKPGIRLAIHSGEVSAADASAPVSELTVYAGETIRAIVRATRTNFDGHIELGKDGAGRNLPHGVYVDNIGLNGLMILQNQVEREFFITAARWVPESDRPFFLKSSVDGITSHPVMLRIRHRGASDSPATASVPAPAANDAGPKEFRSPR